MNGSFRLQIVYAPAARPVHQFCKNAAEQLNTITVANTLNVMEYAGLLAPATAGTNLNGGGPMAGRVLLNMVCRLDG